jgi:hypothetical protein
MTGRQPAGGPGLLAAAACALVAGAAGLALGLAMIHWAATLPCEPYSEICSPLIFGWALFLLMGATAVVVAILSVLWVMVAHRDGLLAMTAVGLAAGMLLVVPVNLALHIT